MARMDEIVERTVRLHAEWALLGEDDTHCCCGDRMDRHDSPMNCGHSPVSIRAYATECLARELLEMGRL